MGLPDHAGSSGLFVSYIAIIRDKRGAVKRSDLPFTALGKICGHILRSAVLKSFMLSCCHVYSPFLIVASVILTEIHRLSQSHEYL